MPEVRTGAPYMRLDSRTRLLAPVILVIAYLLARSLSALGLLFVPLLLAVFLARPPLKPLARSLLVPLPFLVVLAGLQVLFNSNTEVTPLLLQLGKNSITPHDLLNGAMLLVRFAGLVGTITLAGLTLQPSEAARAFERLLSPLMALKIPAQDLALMVMVTLRFIPLLAQTSKRISRAQTARGAEWGKGKGGIGSRVRRVIPVIIPLFVNTLQRSENLASAMQARGYSSTLKRTTLLPIRFRVADGIVLVLVLVYASLVLAFF